MKPTYLLTLDVETTSIARNGLYDDVGVKILEEGLPPLLDLMDKYNFKSTFFYTGYIAKKFPDVVKIVAEKGHEIASHGMSHHPSKAFDVLSLKEQIKNLKQTKNILEDLSGQEIVTFRAPALRVNKWTPEALIETGFMYDSSIASRRFDMFLSFGSFKKLNRLFAPASPYFVNKSNLARKGNSPLLEIPISALLIPYIGTTLRIMPGLTKFIRTILKIETHYNNKPIVFLFHPNEILSENIDVKINRRTSSFINYIFVDYIRRNLKIINLGNNAYKFLKDEINYFQKYNFVFSTIKEYGQSFKNNCANINL